METQIEPSEQNNSGKRKFVVSQRVAKVFEEIQTKLLDREVENFNFHKFLDDLFDTVTEDTITSILEKNTPESYRIKLALNDPELKAQFLKLIESKPKKRRDLKPSAEV